MSFCPLLMKSEKHKLHWGGAGVIPDWLENVGHLCWLYPHKPSFTAFTDLGLLGCTLKQIRHN